MKCCFVFDKKIFAILFGIVAFIDFNLLFARYGDLGVSTNPLIAAIRSNPDTVANEDNPIANVSSEIKKIIAEDPDSVETSDQYGLYPLHVAIKKEKYNIACYLLSSGADYCCVDKDSKNILHYVAERFNSEFFLYVLCNAIGVVGVESLINSKDRFDATPIMIAVRNNNKKIVAFLLALRANPRMTITGGLDSFETACRKGYRGVSVILNYSWALRGGYVCRVFNIDNITIFQRVFPVSVD